MRTVILLFLWWIPTYSIGQNYVISEIPDSLKKNANAVVRADSFVIEVMKPGRVKYYKKEVITILNEKGSEFSSYYTNYNKFEDIKNLYAVLYDANGKEIKKVLKKEFTDEPLEDGISLMNDTRIKMNRFYQKVYPYTVEYVEEDEVNGFIRLESWEPQTECSISIQRSSFEIIAPSDYVVKTKSYNIDANESDAISSFTHYHKWLLEGLKANKQELYAPSWEKIMPKIRVKPSVFEIEHIVGNCNSWKDIGAFHRKMYEGKDKLPDELKSVIHQLTDTVGDKIKKIGLLYQFLQNNTRYISIQLGMGGWEPFDAQFVYKKKYGDCKALSNFMIAMLKEVNITAYTAFNFAGGDKADIDTSFPANNFNHVIVCVPFDNDTIWLECTSKYEAPGYCGSFTGNRHVLVTTEDGGKIVETPHYSINENKTIRYAKIKLHEDGTIDATVKCKYSCLNKATISPIFFETSAEKKQEKIIQNLALPNITIHSTNYTQTVSKYPTIEETLDFTSQNAAIISGKRCMVTPNFFSKNEISLPYSKERKFPIDLSFGFTETDTVVLELPNEYQLEQMPKEVSILNNFGKYAVRYEAVDHKILFYRTYCNNGGVYPVTDYAALKEFLDEVYKLDRSTLVLLKKQ
jgi:hypothetical protein